MLQGCEITPLQGHEMGTCCRGMGQGHVAGTSSTDMKWEHAVEVRNGTMLQGCEFTQEHVAGTKMTTCHRDVK